MLDDKAVLNVDCGKWYLFYLMSAKEPGVIQEKCAAAKKKNHLLKVARRNKSYQRRSFHPSVLELSEARPLETNKMEGKFFKLYNYC